MTKRSIEKIQQMIRNAEEARDSATALINTTKQDIANLALEKQRLETIVSEEQKKKEESKKVVKDSFDTTITAATDGISKTQTAADAMQHAKTFWNALKDTVTSAKENAAEIFAISDAEYSLSEHIPVLESELQEKLNNASEALFSAEADLKMALRKKKHFENQVKLKDLEKQVGTLSEEKVAAEKKIEELTSEVQKTKDLEQNNIELEEELQESTLASSEEIADLKNKLESEQQKEKELEQKLEATQKASEEEVAALKAKLEEEVQKEADLQQQLLELKGSLASEIEKEKDLEQKLETAQKTSEEEVAALKGKLDTEAQEKQKLQDENVKLESKLTSSEEKREQYNDKLQEIVSKYMESQERTNTLSKENAELKVANDSVSKSNEALTAQISALEEQLAKASLVEAPAVNNATESDAQ